MKFLFLFTLTLLLLFGISFGLGWIVWAIANQLLLSVTGVGTTLPVLWFAHLVVLFFLTSCGIELYGKDKKSS